MQKIALISHLNRVLPRGLEVFLLQKKIIYDNLFFYIFIYKIILSVN